MKKILLILSLLALMLCRVQGTMRNKEESSK